MRSVGILMSIALFGMLDRGLLDGRVRGSTEFGVSPLEILETEIGAYNTHESRVNITKTSAEGYINSLQSAL